MFSKRFEVVEKDVEIAGTPFTILKIRDTNALIDSIDAEKFALDERLPYWADIWSSSFELARYCLTEGNLKGKHVLELGCGLGLAGIAAAKAGAFVIFSDYEQDALDFARYNAARNLSLMPATINVLQLDWRTDPDSLLRYPKFDVIIAADVVYERKNFFPLIGVLQSLLAPQGVAVFTEPGRAIGDQFFQLLSESDFDLTTTPCKVKIEGKTSEIRRVAIRHNISGL